MDKAVFSYQFVLLNIKMLNSVWK